MNTIITKYYGFQDFAQKIKEELELWGQEEKFLYNYFEPEPENEGLRSLEIQGCIFSLKITLEKLIMIVENHLVSENLLQNDRGIWVPKNARNESYRERRKTWEEIGENYYGRQQFQEAPPADYTEVIGNPGGLWKEFPLDRHFGTILEIGCGDGRASIHLSKSRGLDCEFYYGIDISEPQLSRLKKFKAAYDFYPSAEFALICMPACKLPLEDNSIDLAISDAVLMHLPKNDVKTLLCELGRVLKPGGTIGFRNSFHNRKCFGHAIRNFVRTFAPNRDPLYFQQYSLEEVYTLLEESKIVEKCGSVEVVSNGQYVLIPRRLGKHKVPLAKPINRWLEGTGLESQRFVYSFDAYSW